MTFFEARLGEPRYRARQAYEWCHRKGVTSIDAMTSLSLALRARLRDCTKVARLEVEQALESSDGSVKFLLRTFDGRAIESVYLPTPTRKTLCVSTQVGCAMGCRFCATAQMGFVRNLTAGEIVVQVHIVNQWLTARGATASRPLSNLVFMGMGEPLHNFENLVTALDILQSQEGPNFSARHITVSTSGLVPRIGEFAVRTRAKLAISLNASEDATRTAIMPINKKWPIAELLDAVRAFPERWGRRITFEYVLLGEVNDRDDDAKRLVKLLAGISGKVNVIPYNENPGLSFRSVSDERARHFQALLQADGLDAFVRENRGRDIAGACGQLAGRPEA